MKKLMLSMALMLSPMAITSSFATGHTDDCGCRQGEEALRSIVENVFGLRQKRKEFPKNIAGPAAPNRPQDRFSFIPDARAEIIVDQSEELAHLCTHNSLGFPRGFRVGLGAERVVFRKRDEFYPARNGQ